MCGLSTSAPIKLPRTPPRKKLETDVKAEVRAALGRLPYVTIWNAPTGLFYTKSGTPVRFFDKGFPDMFGHVTVASVHCCSPSSPQVCAAHRGLVLLDMPIPRMFFLEIKRPGGRLSKEQEAHLNMFRGQHVAAGWVDNVADALAFIEQARRLEI